MKALSAAAVSRRQVLLMILSAVLLTGLICSVTFLRFSSQLYIKRSPNTFVGDEKYQSVRQEVELQLENYRSQGVDGVIEEQVIERVNSKNETTSLVIFTVNAANNRSGWDLLKAALPASRLLIGILFLSAAAWLLTLLSAFTGNRIAGTGSFILALAAFFLIPVIFNRLNLDLSRAVDLAQSGGSADALDRLRPALDRFLFDGSVGDQLDAKKRCCALRFMRALSFSHCLFSIRFLSCSSQLSGAMPKPPICIFFGFCRHAGFSAI